MIERVIDFYWYYVRNLRKYEFKLLKYQGYGTKSILEFKKQNKLDWDVVKVILENFKIIDGLDLRNGLRKFVEDNRALIDDGKTYITHFGPIEKSGSFILNQFMHCYPGLQKKIIKSHELGKLDQDSNIIFLDDFIGTGTQAVDYIKPILWTIGSSVKPYLFTLCGTESGLEKISDHQSKFSVQTGLVLKRKDYFLLDKSCKKFSDKQKKKVEKINSQLNCSNDLNLNLPFAFYYTIPDNSLPLLWLDGDRYRNEYGQETIWYGLTPRNF
jgi:hypothetical protein